MSRNVVLVTVDSLRADHCGFHGYEEDTTPTLDRMADEGLVFENAIAPGPSTPESMSAVHTGEFLKPYDTEDDTPIVNRRRSVQRHLASTPTVAETLSAEGYRTIGFTPNPFTARPFGFQKGFERYEDFLTAESREFVDVYRRLFDRFISGDTDVSPIRLLLNWLQKEEVFKSWEQYYDRIIESVRATTEPFFLWVFLMDAHLPYLVGGSRREGISWLDMWRYNFRLYTDGAFTDAERERLIDLYDATIRRVDEFLDRLRSDLAAADPVYVVHADHGEAFGEHGTYGHEPYVYEENVHVPYLVANGRESGSVSAPVSLRSIPSVVATHAGIDDGRLHPPAGDDATHVFSNPGGGRTAVRGRRWKYIRNSQSTGPDELYDLVADADETRNLSEEHPDLADTCRDLIDATCDHEREGTAVRNALADLVGEVTL